MGKHWESLGDYEFHDSSLIDVTVSPKFDRLRIVIFSPSAKNKDINKKGKFYLLTFGELLRIEYESWRMKGGSKTPYTELLKPPPIDIEDIIILFDEEQKRWERILKAAGKPGRIYHVLVGSMLTKPLNEDFGCLDGISIICQYIDVSDVTDEWTDEYRFYPPIIDGSPE